MNPWLILGFVLAVIGAAGAGYVKGDHAGRATVQQAWDKEHTMLAEQAARDEAAARDKERQMQADADRLRKEKDGEIREISARATALANSLRDRPERPKASDPVPAAAGAGHARARCDGSALPREDAEFLAREAARADELRASLKQCIAQYQALKQ